VRAVVTADFGHRKVLRVAVDGLSGTGLEGRRPITRRTLAPRVMSAPESLPSALERCEGRLGEDDAETVPDDSGDGSGVEGDYGLRRSDSFNEPTVEKGRSSSFPPYRQEGCEP